MPMPASVLATMNALKKSQLAATSRATSTTRNPAPFTSLAAGSRGRSGEESCVAVRVMTPPRFRAPCLAV